MLVCEPPLLTLLFPLLGPVTGGVVVRHQQPVYSVYGKTLEMAQLLALTGKGSTHTCNESHVLRVKHLHASHTHGKESAIITKNMALE